MMTVIRHDGVTTGTNGPVRPTKSFRKALGRRDNSSKALCREIGGKMVNVLAKENCHGACHTGWRLSQLIFSE